MAKRKVRVRKRRLDEIDDMKLSLAVYLIARDLVEDKTTLDDEAAKSDNPPVVPGEETA
jgi:hypothetical protein